MKTEKAKTKQVKQRARARVKVKPSGVTFSMLGWAGEGEAPRRTDLPIAGPKVEGLAVRQSQAGSDIVGWAGAGVVVAVAASPAPCSSGELSGPWAQQALDGSKGVPARLVRVKGARAVGVGADADSKRADALDDWLQAEDVLCCASDVQAERAAILAAIQVEHEDGRKLLTLCGGAGWGDGRRVVTMAGGGMAARAARYVESFRGKRPSSTSLQEAAAAAVAAVYPQFGAWWSIHGTAAAVWTDDSAIRHLASVAWRAAFKSLTDDSREGMTGRKAGQVVVTDELPLSGDSLATAGKALQAWAADSGGALRPVQRDNSRKRALRRASVWLASVFDLRERVTTDPLAKLNESRRVASERARLSVLLRLLHGRDLISASKGAGFASVRACVQSFTAGKVWARLRIKVASHLGEHERAILAVRKRAARQAKQAIKAQRVARAGAGAQVLASSTARTVTLTCGGAVVTDNPVMRSQVASRRGGLSRVQRPLFSRVVSVEHVRGAGAVHPLAGDWRNATAARGQAVQLARDSRKALRTVQASRVAQFDAATKGWRSGWRDASSVPASK